MISILRIALCLAGWAVAVVWLAIRLGGGKKDLQDYVQSVQFAAIGPGETVWSKNAHQAVWSGWWSPTKGFRWSNSGSPDIAFRWHSDTAANCVLAIAAFPAPMSGTVSQPIYWRTNRGEWQGPLKIDLDRTYALGTTQLGEGTNLLSFYFPDAGQPAPQNLRVAAIGLHWFRFDCPAAGPLKADD